jgi:hypothetical protein
MHREEQPMPEKRAGAKECARLHRAAERIASGHAAAFAPAKKMFAEWAPVAKHDEHRFTKRLEASIALVDG